MLGQGSHTLTIQPDFNDSYKHCILVKLTDSCAKAIEDFIKNKSNSSANPYIVFQKEREKGELYFPTEAKTFQNQSDQASNSSNNAEYKKFGFSLSSTKESNKLDSSASCECICYSNSKLKTIGTLEQKLTIQGNEEVFQATKEKVNIVAEEHKNNSTIEIKPSGAIVNRTSTSNLNVNNTNRFKMSSSLSSLKKSTQESSSLASSINRNQEDIRSSSETIKTKIDRLTLGKFREIVTKSQYDEYLNEFEQSYEEYLELHSYIESITKLFESYKSSLDSIKDLTSGEYKERKQEIFKEFYEKNNSEYNSKKEKYNFLHSKLTLLNKLMDQYKENLEKKNQL